MFLYRCHDAKAVIFCSVIAAVISNSASAAITAPGLIKDINPNTIQQPDVLAVDPTAQGENFSPGSNVFASPGGTPYGVDVDGALNGNDLLVVTQGGTSAGNGAGFTIHVSNGENGSDYSYNARAAGPIIGSNPSNTVAPADPAFAAIGNPSGRLEDGNVVRFSTWVRNDPLAPMTVEPQITPIIKLEFWRDALSSDADSPVASRTQISGAGFLTPIRMTRPLRTPTVKSGCSISMVMARGRSGPQPNLFPRQLPGNKLFTPIQSIPFPRDGISLTRLPWKM